MLALGTTSGRSSRHHTPPASGHIVVFGYRLTLAHRKSLDGRVGRFHYQLAWFHRRPDAWGRSAPGWHPDLSLLSEILHFHKRPSTRAILATDSSPAPYMHHPRSGGSPSASRSPAA